MVSVAAAAIALVVTAKTAVNLSYTNLKIPFWGFLFSFLLWNF
jgi:hypothetical protein